MRGAKKNAPRAKVPHPALKDSAVLSRLGEEREDSAMADDAHREGKPTPAPLIRDRARELRRVSTDAERIPNEVSGNINGVLDTIAGQLPASPRGERPREARVRDRSA
jgi:hypothetical protein